MAVMSGIRISIDELVVEGGTRADAQQLGRAIQDSLTALLASDPAIGVGARQVRVADIGPIPAGPPVVMGRAIAHEIHKGLVTWR